MTEKQLAKMVLDTYNGKYGNGEVRMKLLRMKYYPVQRVISLIHELCREEEQQWIKI